MKFTHWWASCSFSFSLYFSVWTCNLPIWQFSGHLGNLYSSWLLTNNAVTNVLVCVSWWLHTHTHTHSFLLHTKPQKRMTGSHIHTCAVLVFIASFPNVLSTLCNQITVFPYLSQCLSKILWTKAKRQYLWNISAEILTQFNFFKWSCDYPLFIS